MNKLLIVVDMQNDFITGTLGSPQAEAILPYVKAKVESYKQNGGDVVFTRDTHQEDYLTTREGELLPVAHCIEGTAGHMISDALDVTFSNATCCVLIFVCSTFCSNAPSRPRSIET